jgi:cysteine desulfuration protein SufE
MVSPPGRNPPRSTRSRLTIAARRGAGPACGRGFKRARARRWLSPRACGYNRRIAADPSAPLTSIETIRADFAFLDEWEDRYRYVIELGRTLEPLAEADHNDANKVRGCVSQVWLLREPRHDAAGRAVSHYRGDSDSHLVRGLVAIAIALYSDHTPQEILATDAFATFRELGLEQHLTPQRSNGVRAMIERIRADAYAPA